jgi:hypothetical protein
MTSKSPISNLQSPIAVSPIPNLQSLVSKLHSPFFWLKALLVVALGLLAAPQLWYPFGFDQGVYAACGDVIRRGGIPIQDCFETKQPGVMVMYAIPMLISLAPMAIHAFTLLWTALTAIVIGVTASRLFHPSAAWPAAVLYWLAYAGINYWSMDQAETFANLFLVIALLGAWLGSRPSKPGSILQSAASRRGWLIVGGVCIGISFWFKYVFALVGIALAVCIMIQIWLRTHSLARALGPAFLYGIVALGVAGLGALYYALNGALPALASQFQFLLAAFPLGPARTLPQILEQLARFLNNGADVTADFKATMPQWIFLGGGFPLIALLALIGAWRWARREPMLYVFLLVHFVAAAAIVVWQANYIQYHYTIMLPAFILAAAGNFGFTVADLRSKRSAHATGQDLQNLKQESSGSILKPQISITKSIMSIGLLVLTCALLAVRMLPWVSDCYQNVIVRGKTPRTIYLESNVAANVPLAEYVASHTQPTDTIAIFGDAPWVYTLSNRRNATRFSFVNLWLRKREAITYPLFTGQFLDGLERNQPVYFILTKPDFPWPNNDYTPDYKAATDIYNYIESHYAYEGENGPFLLFRRKS